MHIVCVCGLGMGSSLILKMTVTRPPRNWALPATRSSTGMRGPWTAGAPISSSPHPTSRSRFAGRDNVIFVKNVVNTAEVKEQLKAYLEANRLL